MNKCIVIGNLTKDPDVRVTGNGVSVCTFTVAVQRRIKNQSGEREADFLPVVCWRGLADICGKYLNKGSKVGVCGAIQTRSYDAQDGTKRYVTEIIADEVEFLDRRDQNGQGDHSAPHPSISGLENMSFGEAVDDDELPF